MYIEVEILGSKIEGHEFIPRRVDDNFISCKPNYCGHHGTYMNNWKAVKLLNSHIANIT